ncbi:unannotated protein [freshwater metagenome]|uniref:Unannotated protein n=1 Tax=freshwater metagenome TaxID=449393 RepID=A0A6J7IR37_9ZZZZ
MTEARGMAIHPSGLRSGWPANPAGSGGLDRSQQAAVESNGPGISRPG